MEHAERDYGTKKEGTLSVVIDPDSRAGEGKKAKGRGCKG